jgi:hypothetical protein
MFFHSISYEVIHIFSNWNTLDLRKYVNSRSKIDLNPWIKKSTTSPQSIGHAFSDNFI